MPMAFFNYIKIKIKYCGRILGLLATAQSAQIQINKVATFPDLGLLEGKTNCLKKHSKKLFLFSKAVEKFLQTIFSGGMNFSAPQMITPIPNRSPSQAVINAAGMVFWVI
jgi:hypothetical protein